MADAGDEEINDRGEPWAYDDLDCVIHDRDKSPMADAFGGWHSFDQGDWERIAACVNACAGIPTAALELAAERTGADRLATLAGYAEIASRAARKAGEAPCPTP